MSATPLDIVAEQGAALSLTLTGSAGVLTGRTLVMHVRATVPATTVKLAASTADGRLSVTGERTALLQIPSDVMAAVVVTDPVEVWHYDVESYTDATDVRREWAGRWPISRDVTRDTEADLENRLAGLVRYDSPQTLTTAQKTQARDNIGAGTGGGGGAAAWGDITGTLSAQTDLQSALDLKAPAASPTLTGTPAAPTATSGTSTTQIATTAFVGGAVSTHSALTTGAHGITAAGAALLDDADAAAQRTTLGLGTAATQASGAFEVSGAVSTHNAVTTAHGISAFGATLVDDASASAARTTLGLGTAATTAATDYATAAQGATADTAVQPARTVSTSGLATGGGDLSANRTITVTAASASTVSTGTATTEALTPGAYKDSTPYYVSRTADWTLALTDRNKDQWFNNGGSALVCTIPLNATVAFAIGDTIPFVRLASGTATIDADTSVTLNGVSGGSCTISTQYQGALLKKIGTDSWVVSGDVSAVA